MTQKFARHRNDQASMRGQKPATSCCRGEQGVEKAFVRWDSDGAQDKRMVLQIRDIVLGCAKWCRHPHMMEEFL